MLQKQEAVLGHVTRQKKLQIKLFFQGKINSDAEMQSVSANKLFLQSENKISSELLFDALLSDNVDVHSLTADDVEHSLTVDDAAVCSYSMYTRPQLTDRPPATTQPGQQPSLVVSDTAIYLLQSTYTCTDCCMPACHQCTSTYCKCTSTCHQCTSFCY